MRATLLPLLLPLLLPACGPEAATSPRDTDTGAPPTVSCDVAGPRDDELTLADVQAVGSHNSYHRRPDVVLHPSHDYEHPPLDVQLDLGVRAFELDVHRRADGSFAVFHLPAIDEVSTCDALADCLGTIAAWSDAHPCHVPIVVWIEPKDEIDGNFPELTMLEGHLDELDDTVRAALPRLLTPDAVRGAHPDLPTALAADGWPTLAATRGHVVVAMLDGGAHRTAFLEGRPAAQGRAMFAGSSRATDPFAALFKINDAAGSAERVGELVRAGFVVSSNAREEDGPGAEAARDAALAAGPHHLKSDHVLPGDGYHLTLPGGSPRCHPLRVPEGCDAPLEP